jgi:hypothetical protein
VCSTDQLYRAFKRWALLTGERFPPPQVTFSKGVEKAAAGRLRLQPYKLDKNLNGRDWMRMWLPGDSGPPEGQAAGEWAREAAEEFEEALRRFSEDGAPSPHGAPS